MGPSLLPSSHLVELFDGFAVEHWVGLRFPGLFDILVELFDRLFMVGEISVQMDSVLAKTCLNEFRLDDAYEVVAIGCFHWGVHLHCVVASSVARFFVIIPTDQSLAAIGLKVPAVGSISREGQVGDLLELDLETLVVNHCPKALRTPSAIFD